MNGGSRSGRNCGGHGGRGSNGVGVLGVVAPVPVAVLEVQPEVLDRLAAELRGHTGSDGGSQVGVLAQQLAELFQPAVAPPPSPAPGRPSPRRSDGVKRSAGT
jgi:hypothetical protein